MQTEEKPNESFIAKFAQQVAGHAKAVHERAEEEKRQRRKPMPGYMGMTAARV
jgi:hypothetical protein